MLSDFLRSFLRPFFSAHSLPMYREKRIQNMKKKKEVERKDALKSHQPELPITGHGKEQRTGTSWLVKTCLRGGGGDGVAVDLMMSLDIKTKLSKCAFGEMEWL